MAHGRPDFSPTAVDIVLRPEWAAKEATDKNFYGFNASVASDVLVSVDYTVPSGKTLYITQMACSSFGGTTTEKDYNHIVEMIAAFQGLTDPKLRVGGNGGVIAVFNKPLVYVAADAARFSAVNRASITTGISIHASVYEL